MLTRAIYTFIDKDSKHHVYKHQDNDIRIAVKFIGNALTKSWELPKFEAHEFAAAFIAANKKAADDVRIIHTNDAFGLDVNRYEISCVDGKIYLRAFEVREHLCFFEGFMDDLEKDWIIRPWKVTVEYKDGSEVSYEFTQQNKAKRAFNRYVKLMDCNENIECVGYKPGKLAA